MRILITLFFLSVLCTTVRAQHETTKNENAPPSPHEAAFSAFYQDSLSPGPIHGLIRNLPDSLKGKLEIKYTAASICSSTTHELSTPVAEDGSFSLRLPENYPVTRVVYYIDDIFINSFIIRTGITLDVDYELLEEDSEEAYRYTGADALLTKTVNTHRDSVWRWDKNLKNLSFNLLLDDKLRLAKKHGMLDSVYAAHSALDETFIQRMNVPADIAAVLRNERKTEYLYHLCVIYIEGLPDSVKARCLAHRPLVMSYNTLGFYDNFNYSMRNAFRAGWTPDTTASQQEQDLSLVRHQLAYLDANFAPTRADLHKLYPQNDDPATDARITELVLQSVTTPWIAGLVSKRRDEKRAVADRIAAVLARADSLPAAQGFGTPVASYPFGAELFLPPAEMNAEELLNNLRAAFPGKALYLDFWAVWCGPCLGEFPHSAKLHGMTHDLPVEFVYVCTEYGGDEKKWKQKITENELPGTHLFLTKARHIQLMDLFNGRGYPTYAVVTAEGDTKNNVKRPSQLDRDKFRRLLKIK